MATFFALVTIPKDQLKGTTPYKTANNLIDEPKYPTELAVTQAIVSGELNGFGASDAYEAAKQWQRHLKAIKPRFFAKKTGKPVPSGKYMHVMFQQ